MLWRPKRENSSRESDAGRGSVQWAVAEFAGAATDSVAGTAVVPRQGATPAPPITTDRLAAALEAADVRHVRDGNGALVAMWERYAVLFELEGPDDEIVVIRARSFATVPCDWAARAYTVVNEWNHSSRFGKAYVGDLDESGELPLYLEVQAPFGAGAHHAQLVELVECAVREARSFIGWLHDEGALL